MIRAFCSITLVVALAAVAAGCRDPQCRPGTIFVRADCPKGARSMQVTFTATRPGWEPAVATVTTTCPSPATLEVKVSGYDTAKDLTVRADALVDDNKPHHGLRLQLPGYRLADECTEWDVRLDEGAGGTGGSQGPDASACDEAGCPKLANGERCNGGDDCESSHCVDGVCCNDACNGACRTCADRPGQCTLVTAGNADPRDICRAQSTAICGTSGACDGKGGCAYYGAETVCGGATCDGNIFTATRACNGAGECAKPFSVACAGGFACGAGACKTTCSTNDDCAGNYFCAAGSACALKKPVGEACTLNTECAEGRCVDGYCCNSACGLSCDVCNASGKLGMCTLVAGYDLCNGMCANRQTDPANCGECGNACATGQTCKAGKCTGTIEADLIVQDANGVAFSGTVRQPPGSVTKGSFSVGENALDGEAQRIFLTWDLKKLPATAIVTRATLKMVLSLCFGDPFAAGHGDVIVEHVIFGSLFAADFDVPVQGPTPAFVPLISATTASAGTKEADLTSWVAQDWADRTKGSRRPETQFRIRFATNDIVVNGQRAGCGLATGNGSQPHRLDVEYEIP